MGSFPGHALPGSFFIVFGLWYTVQAYRRYFQCRESGARFTTTMIFPCSFLCGRFKHWPVEPIIKIVCCVIGFIAEIQAGFNQGKFVGMNNAQHATMFFFFGISGFVDILLHYKFPLPLGTDYISFAMALAVEGIIFKFHLYGRGPLDVLLHTLLLYVIAIGIVSLFAEMRFRHHLLCPLSRAYSLMLQGTWFWQVGNILYSPHNVKWDQHDHEQRMLATLYFTWHAGANFILILLIGAITSCRYKNYEACGNDLITSEQSSVNCKHTLLHNVDDDSGSD